MKKLLYFFATLSVSSSLYISAMEQAVIEVSSAEGIIAVIFPTNNRVVTGGENGLTIFDTKTHQAITLDKQAVSSLAAKKNGDLFVVSNNAGLSVYNAINEHKIWTNNSVSFGTPAVFCPKRDTLIALVAEQKAILLCNYTKTFGATKYSIPSCKSHHDGAIFISCNPTVVTPVEIASIDANKRASVIELASYSDSKNTDVLSSPQEVAYSPNGKIIAIANGKNGCMIWNPSSTESSHIGTDQGLTNVISMAFHPNGTLALLDLNGFALKYWDLKTSNFIATENFSFISTHSGSECYIKRLDFSPDGKSVIILGHDRCIVAAVPKEIIGKV